MQLYLKDGMEIREVQFTNEEVQNYCELLNIKYDHYVPTLMCAKLWPQFELFQSFSKKPIIRTIDLKLMLCLNVCLF